MPTNLPNHWFPLANRERNMEGEAAPHRSGEISSLLDRKLARWSTTSCALTLACQLYVEEKTTKQQHNTLISTNYAHKPPQSLVSVNKPGKEHGGRGGPL